jgi:hypothetical protein
MVSHSGSALRYKKKFFDFFPPPKFLLLSTEGIAVTETAVQFIQFGKGTKSGGLELVHCTEAPVEAGAVRSGSIENKEALVKALKDLKTRFGVKFVHATLPEERAYLFTVVLEKVPYDNLRDAVAFTIEDNAPVSLAESIFDFEVIGATEGKSEVKVAVSVLPVEVVESYTSVFEDAGITPISFDVESQAMARALVGKDDARSHLIVNLGGEKTGLYVAEEEVAQFSSTLPYGTNGDVGLTNLKAEMHKLFAFWNTRVDKHGTLGQRIEKILFTGAGAKDEAFIAALMSGIEIEYSIGNVWANAFSFDEYIPEVSFEQSLSLGAAIGAALPIREVDYI